MLGALVSLAALLAACSPRTAAERAVLGRTVQRIADVPYGEGPRHRLDVYRRRDPRRRAPVVVFLYGGRWQDGSRRDYVLLGNTLARRGWLVVIPDYRLHPAELFPAWVEDGARAVRWTRDHATRLGGDTTRLFVVGHSAGAHTAALLALDDRWLRGAGVAAGAVRGVVALAGPVDTVWTDPDVQRLMGPRDGWPATYPVTHVDGTGPPLLLLHGADDGTVLPGNSVRLASRIRERGGCARALVYPGIGHVGIVVAFALPWLGTAPVLADVARFVRAPDAVSCPERAGAPPRAP